MGSEPNLSRNPGIFNFEGRHGARRAHMPFRSYVELERGAASSHWHAGIGIFHALHGERGPYLTNLSTICQIWAQPRHTLVVICLTMGPSMT